MESLQARRTRKAIRNGLIELLEKRSINDITMAALAEAADVDRSTIYRYYSSMLDVLGDCLYEIAGTADRYIPTASNWEDFMQEIYEAVERSYQGISANRKLYALTQQQHRITFGSMEHVFRIESRSNAYYRGIVQGLQDMGLALTVSPRYLECVLSGASGSIVNYWIESGFSETAEEMAQRTITTFEAIIRSCSNAPLPSQ